MMKFYRIFYGFILRRRYRISFKGMELLQKEGGKLVLPNHQSHVDPQLVGVFFYKYTHIVPVVNENFFKIPFISFFLKRWGAIPVANFKKGNRDPNVLKNIFSKVNIALDEGKSVIIFPAGQLQDIGVEHVRNKQATHAVISSLEDDKIRIIGVRITGLWGSTFSKAWTGEQPPFLPVFLKGFFYFFANLIFLAPKREVTFELVDITEEALAQSKNDRITFNNYLDSFYNINGIEEPSFIKHFFFFPKSKRKLPVNVVKKTEKWMAKAAQEKNQLVSD